MRLLPLAVCLCAAVGCIPEEKTGPRPIESYIPARAPDFTIVRTVAGTGESKATVFEVSHDSMKYPLREQDLEEAHRRIAKPLAELAMIGAPKAQPPVKTQYVKGERSNTWRAVIGPADMPAKGVLKVEIWMKEDYPAVVTFSEPPSAIAGDWIGPATMIVRTLDVGRSVGSTSSYVLGPHKNLLKVSK
jgi:hypothetical protein